MEKIVKQRVFFLGENDDIKQLLKAVTDHKRHRCFDFNKIVPVPPEVYSGPLNGDAIAEYGENNWYDWCKKNWGTMNNACDPSVCGNMLELDTVYSLPRPIYVALSQQHQNVQIKVTYASKDRSSIGIELYKNGRFEKVDSELDEHEIWHALWGEAAANQYKQSNGGITDATSA